MIGTYWKSTLLAEPYPTTFLIYADWLEESGNSKSAAGWRRSSKFKPCKDAQKRWNWFNRKVAYSVGGGASWKGNPPVACGLPFKIFKVIAKNRGHDERGIKRLWLMIFKGESQARRALVHALLEVYPYVEHL